jgi:hypothetical protein
MRVIKLGFISIIAFALLISFISIFFPSTVRISRATDINSSKHVVERYIYDTTLRKGWYPVDSTNKLAGNFNVYESGLPNTVTVQWLLQIHVGRWPWQKFSGLLLEKRYGPVLETGLEKLKRVITGQQEKPGS